MTELPAETARPLPRWLHQWAVLCVGATFALLLVGQMVTSFRAGMADPIWPTEPWYLFSNYKLDLGYLIEHSHRILGFTIGGLAVVLAAGLWWTEPRSGVRRAGLFGLFFLLVGYGNFHRDLIAQRDLPAAQVTLLTTSLGWITGGLLLVLGTAVSGILVRVPHAGTRLLGVLALVAVMIQGLLGGFRVKLNELVGTDLAAVHGVFAQVVFGLLVTVAVLTARPATSTQRVSATVRGWAAGLAVLLFVQVVWGAMVRHDPTPLTQRLHFLTAFAATAAAVWVLVAVFADPAVRSRIGYAGHLLALLLAVQLYLGVEAWMEKFDPEKLREYGLLEMVPVTKEIATIRTLHALVGSGLLATALGLAVRLNAGGETERGGNAG